MSEPDGDSLNDEPSWDEAIRQSQATCARLRSSVSTNGVGRRGRGRLRRVAGRADRAHPAKAKLILPTRAIAEALAARMGGAGRDARAARDADDAARQFRDRRRRAGARRGARRKSPAMPGRISSAIARSSRSLVEMQARAWDPVLAWAERELGGRFVLAGGWSMSRSPPIRLRRARAAFFSYESPFAVAALHGLTSLSGSALLALAVARGAFSAEDAWRAAHVDEDYQIELLGRRRGSRAAPRRALARVPGRRRLRA